MAGQRTYTMPITVNIGPASHRPDPLEEARRERQLAEQAATDLEAWIEGARALFGDTLADALTRSIDRAAGGFAVSCDRYEQAVERLKSLNTETETEIVDRGRQITELITELAAARAEVMEWKNLAAGTADENDALQFVLRRAVTSARRWSGKKKGRRVPGFVKAAEILLDGEAA